MSSNRKQRICALLKGIETGDPESVTVVNEARYIQHNPQTQEGSEGLAALFRRLASTSPRVNIVRVFEDGDYVFGHTEYDFATRNIGFEVFRFEGDQAVEHWDNIQPRQGPNASGRSMVDGPTEVGDLDRSEANRELVRKFVDDILVNRRLNELENYLQDGGLIQHSPRIADGLPALRAALQATSGHGRAIEYRRLHRVLAEGNFVLAASEGSVEGLHSAFYDLFRVADGKIVEHWDTVEAIPPREEWKNDNGKF